MTTSDSHPWDDLAVYAVDALDGPERRALERHLARCRTCGRELDSLRATAARLVEPMIPPARVWQRIARRTGVTRPARRARLPVRPTVLGGLAAAAAAVVLLGAIWFGHDTGESDAPAVALTDGQNHQRAHVVLDETASHLVFDDLEPLTEGGTYQLWHLDGPAPVSLGLLGDATTSTVAVHVPPGTKRVAVTAEARGGSAAPTGPVVARGLIAGGG